MGKHRSSTKPPRKDGFFIKKSRGNVDRNKNNSLVASAANTSHSQSSSTASGSFFVTPSEKQEILKIREGRKNFKTKRNNTEKDSKTAKPKKEFDKKKWRLQKYSNQYKLQQWEEKRKKVVLHEYYRQIKDEPKPKFDVQKIYEQYDNENEYGEQEETENDNNFNSDLTEGHRSISKDSNISNLPSKGKLKGFKKAHLEYQRIQEEKKQKKEEIKRKKLEKAEALKKYKENKLEKYKKLNKKTKKGQPIMKYRMEMLLEQIQKSVQ